MLPVWLLLAPRDYLSTFMKLGTVAALGVADRALLGAGAADAGADADSSTAPARSLPGPVFPVLLHHHRVRRDLRLPLADRSRAPRRSCHGARGPASVLSATGRWSRRWASASWR
jgi:hypothetical protein